MGRVKKRDLQSTIAATKAAGLEINSIAVHPDGGFELKTGKPVTSNKESGNSWDEVLSDATEIKVPANIRR
jgi:hypothetical protein